MAVCKTLDPSHSFIHSRVVLHRAGAQRIHTKVDGIVPRREAREVADDFNLAHFGHVAEIFSFRCAEKFRSVYFRNIEGRQLPGSFAGGGLFKDQSFVLINVEGGFRSSGLHRATSSASSLVDRTGASLFATPATAASIAERVVSSVQHHNAAFPSSG